LSTSSSASNSILADSSAKEKEIPIDFANKIHIVECPYSDCKFQIGVMGKEIACKIFRCGMSLDPHASQSICTEWNKTKTWYDGCGRPIFWQGPPHLAICYVYK